MCCYGTLLDTTHSSIEDQSDVFIVILDVPQTMNGWSIRKKCINIYVRLVSNLLRPDPVFIHTTKYIMVLPKAYGNVVFVIKDMEVLVDWNSMNKRMHHGNFLDVLSAERDINISTVLIITNAKISYLIMDIDFLRHIWSFYLWIHDKRSGKPKVRRRMDNQETNVYSNWPNII
jgi:hypothetical protein